MFNRLRPLLLLLTFVISSTAQANSVEAVGRGKILNGDIDKARTLAVNRAKEQASLYAMAQIATTQSIRDGILEIDNLRVNTLAKINNIEILDERIQGEELVVHIRADLKPQQGCADQSKATAYKKTIGLLQWTINAPAAANLGGLHLLTTLLPQQISLAFEKEDHILSLDASGLRLPTLPANYSLNTQAQTELQAITSKLNAQYLLAGRITNLSMESPVSDTDNVLLANPVVDLVNRSGLLPPKDTRYFEADIDLIDSATGTLLQRYHLKTHDSWRLNMHKNIQGIEGFAGQPYGQAVLSEIHGLVNQLSESLLCQPLTANIVRVQGTKAWIDRGSLSGINPGDRLSIARKVQIYDSNMIPVTDLVPTDINLRIDQIEAGRAVGTLSQPSEVANIQAHDLAIGN